MSALHTPPKNVFFEGRTSNSLCVCFLELLLVGKIMPRSEGTEVKLSPDGRKHLLMDLDRPVSAPVSLDKCATLPEPPKFSSKRVEISQ